MSKKEEFGIILDSNSFFKKGDILMITNLQELEILEDPHKKWWKAFLQWITWGWYKAPHQYKVRVIK